MQSEEQAKPTIVVCPSSLTLNWQNEIQKFAPELTSIVIHGSNVQRKQLIDEIPNFNVIIISYDSLKRDVDVFKEKRI